MKKVLFSLATAFLANAAVAAPISCSGGIWNLTVESNSAVLSANQKLVAKLNCQSVLTPTYPSQTRLQCSTRYTPDAGYLFSAVLSAEGSNTGTLSEQTIAGPRKVADLFCVSAVDTQD